MHVVVCGASGSTGRQLVGQALERGWQVTAVVRGGEHPAPSNGLHVEAIDVFDPAAVAPVIDGTDALISVIGARLEHGADTDVYSASARSFVRALAGTRCRRLVLCTAAALDEPDDRDPWIQDHIVEPLRRWGGRHDMQAAERVLAESDLEWVVVRPGRLHDRPPLGAVEVTEEFRPELGTALARADLARFMLDQVQGNDWLRRTATLASPWD